MAREIDPKETDRAEAFALWLHAPMPMLTLFKTLDVTRLVRAGRRMECGPNALMCWCIGQAAARTKEFYLLPVGDKLMEYDRLAVNVVVSTGGGGINTCDVPFSPDLGQFCRNYRRLTAQVRDTGLAHELGEDYMVIGTSTLTGFELDGAVNIYAGIYNNPFLIWGKFRKKLWRTTLPISFQFHHSQMDGLPAAAFLERLQEELNALPTSKRSTGGTPK